MKTTNRRRKSARKRLAVGLLLIIALLSIVLTITLASAKGDTNRSEIIYKYISEYEVFSASDISFLQDPALPDSIRSFVERYPETISFAANYSAWSTAPPEKELNPDEYDSDYPLLIQWDKRWGYFWYGDDYLGTNGCGPAALAMVYAGLSKDYSWSPAKLAEWADENNYYTDGAGTTWSFMSEGAEQLGLTATQIPLSYEDITSGLKARHPIICNMGPGDFTKAGHYIVLTGLTKEGLLKINDPNSPVRSSRLWDIETVLSQAKAAWEYEYEYP